MTTTPLQPTGAAAALLRPQADALCRHLHQCRDARGRWFGAARRAEALHRVVAPRFVTTIVLATVVLVAASAWS